jgi:hypothetical protein
MAGPRESLAEVLGAPEGGEPFTLEDHFGETQANDLLARIARLAATGRTPAGFTLGASLLELPAPGAKLRLELESSPDGARARAVATRTLCEASLRFAEPAGATSYQDAGPPANLPDPDSLPATAACARAEGWPEAYAEGPVEFRRVGPRWPTADDGHAKVSWMKLRRELPRGDAALELAALVFLASFYPHWEFEGRIGPGFDYTAFALRAVTVCVHVPLRWDDWLLLEGWSPLASGGHALASRRIFDRRGRWIASSFHVARVG